MRAILSEPTTDESGRAFTADEWYALPEEERSRIYKLPHNLENTYKFELARFARHKCREESVVCNTCKRAAKVLAILNDWRE